MSYLIIVTIWNLWSRDIIYKYEKVNAWRSHVIGLKSSASQLADIALVFYYYTVIINVVAKTNTLTSSQLGFRVWAQSEWVRVSQG